MDSSMVGNVPLLERLAHAWRVNAFDTRGPHQELLTLLSSSVKALLDAATTNTARIAALEDNAAPVAAAAAAVAECREGAARLAEANRRVDFLWAAQGFSTLDLQQPAPVPNSVRPIASAAPHAFPDRGFDHASLMAVTPTPDERLDAASIALKQSIQNQQLLSRVTSGGAHDPAWQAALDERLTATEDVIDGVFAVAKQLQAQAHRTAVELDKVNRFALALESRVSVNGTSIARVVEQREAAEVKLRNDVDTLRRRLDEALNNISKVDESWRKVAATDVPTLKTEVDALRAMIPTPASVKSLVAKAAAERDAATKQAALTAEQFHADLRALSVARDALFAVVDVKQRDAVAVLQDSHATEPQLKQRWLALAHQGLPFKAIITGLQELRLRVDTIVQDIATQQSTFKQQMTSLIASQAALSFAPPPVMSSSAAPTVAKRPLGLRLKDAVVKSRTAAGQNEPCCLVAEVVPESLAEALGFTAGLSIVAVGGRPVSSRAQFEEAWRLNTSAAKLPSSSSGRGCAVTVCDPAVGVTSTIEIPV